MVVKGLSKGIAESIVLGKDLGNTFKNIADQILIKLIGALVEVAIKIGVQIALENTTIVALLTKLGIEKQITAEKKKQNNETKSGNIHKFIDIGLDFRICKGGAYQGETVVVEKEVPNYLPNSSDNYTISKRYISGSVNVNFNITLWIQGFDEHTNNRGTITAT